MVPAGFSSISEMSSDWSNRPDVVLEPTAKAFVEDALLHGDNVDAVLETLSAYTGHPQLYAFMLSEWAPLFQLDRSHITKRVLVEALLDVVVDQFDEHAQDTQWIDAFMDVEEYEPLAIALMQRYPQSTFTQHALDRLQHHHQLDKVLHLPAMTTKAYTLSYAASKHLVACLACREDALEHYIQPLQALCCYRLDAYMVAMAMLTQLTQHARHTTIAKLLEHAACASVPPCRTIIGNVRCRLFGIRPEAFKLLVNIAANHDAYAMHHTPPPVPSALDVTALYRLFMNDTLVPPDHDVLQVLVYSVFYATASSESMDNELKDRYIWLIGHMAHAQQHTETLKRLATTLPRYPSVSALSAALDTCMEYLDVEMACYCMVVWARSMLIGTEYYDTYYKSGNIPPLHLLLEEIASRHPPLRHTVFQTFVFAYHKESASLSPTLLIELRKLLLDHVLVLLQLGHVYPTLRFVLEAAKHPDAEKSLFAEFLVRVLQLIQPPYPQLLCDALVELALCVVSHKSDMDTQLIAQFLQDAPHHHSKEKLQRLL
jgi:negative elongation factor C/D